MSPEDSEDSTPRKVRKNNRRVVRKARRASGDLSTREKAKQDVQRAKEKAGDLKRKARNDAKAAERAARRKKDEVKRKAGNDIRRADRASAVDVARALAAKRSREGVDLPESSSEAVRRAGDAAELNAPVEATLDPGVSGAKMEMFAMGGVGVGVGSEGERTRGGTLSAGFIVGGEDDSGTETAVDDSFIMGGGTDEEDDAMLAGFGFEEDGDDDDAGWF